MMSRAASARLARGDDRAPRVAPGCGGADGVSWDRDAVAKFNGGLRHRDSGPLSGSGRAFHCIYGSFAVTNVIGTSIDKASTSWLLYWATITKSRVDKCCIAGCTNSARYGGHMYVRCGGVAAKQGRKKINVILPICPEHNKHPTAQLHSRDSGTRKACSKDGLWLTTKRGVWLAPIVEHEGVIFAARK
jgi:hypothetical protein